MKVKMITLRNPLFTNQDKPCFVIVNSEGKACTLHYGKPTLTDNAQLRYSWPTAGEAEAQRPLYENALDVPLTVTESTR